MPSPSANKIRGKMDQQSMDHLSNLHYHFKPSCIFIVVLPSEAPSLFLIWAIGQETPWTQWLRIPGQPLCLYKLVSGPLFTWSSRLGTRDFFLPCPLCSEDHWVLLSEFKLLVDQFFLPISKFISFVFLEQPPPYCQGGKTLRFWIGVLQIKRYDKRYEQEKNRFS